MSEENTFWYKLTSSTTWSPDFFKGRAVEVVTPSAHLRVMLYEQPDREWVKERAKDGCYARTVELPEPPPSPEKGGESQRESDELAFAAWNVVQSARIITPEMGWKAALQMRDQQNACDLQEMPPVIPDGTLCNIPATLALDRLRKRAGLPT